jgi:hypothetical protein
VPLSDRSTTAQQLLNNRKPSSLMPFDPNYPPTNAEILSAPLRSQFQGLKNLIDAILTVNAAAVDSTTTLPNGVRWCRSCLARPPANGFQASGLAGKAARVLLLSGSEILWSADESSALKRVLDGDESSPLHASNPRHHKIWADVDHQHDLSNRSSRQSREAKVIDRLQADSPTASRICGAEGGADPEVGLFFQAVQKGSNGGNER